MFDISSIRNWIEQKRNLKLFAAAEMVHRKEIFNEFFPTGSKGKTSHRIIQPGDGSPPLQITAKEELYLKVKREDILSHSEVLTDEEKEAILWIPVIIKKNYKKLPDDSILKTTLVTASFGSPSMTIVDAEIK